jgi:hypothetical protein
MEEGRFTGDFDSIYNLLFLKPSGHGSILYGQYFHMSDIFQSFLKSKY